MYIVTNRRIDENKAGIEIFGSTPNTDGSLGLRFVEVVKSGKSFETTLMDDRLSAAEVENLKAVYGLALDSNCAWYASLKVACEVFERARTEKKHILVYVHGYNNDVEQIVKTAFELENLYNVIVLPFSWPANGGNPVTGTAAYLSDKRDARASVGALEKTVAKLHQYHTLLTAAITEKIKAEAALKHPDDYDKQRALYSKMLEKECTCTLNLLCHSMGNYLLKYALQPSESYLRNLVFDNICLVAADANNAAHAEWLETIQVRNRVYVVINENDHALGWSRRKPGEAQLARLGHYLRNLLARNAFYLNVTNSSWVKNDHSYFKGQPVSMNIKLIAMFAGLFEGRTVEDSLDYRVDLNAYELK